MRKILTGLLLIITTGISSQNTTFNILNNEKVVGKNLLTNTEIRGTEYIFPDRIHETYIDTTSGFLTVQLRGLSKNGKWLDNNGNILLYDLKEQKLKWSKKIAYQTGSLQQFSNTLIYTVANKSYCLDIANGNELWEVKNNIYFVDPEYSIGIGYKYKNSTGYTNNLEGINLKNGDKIWEKELDREYGWNDLFYINDSSILIVAAGLHTINLKNGNGWDYNTITGKKDYKGVVAANAVGIAAGLLTGTFITSTGHDLVRDIVSNVLIDSSDIYFASKEQLAKIDRLTGKVIWSSPFPKDLSSKSSIFLKDSLLFLINKGYAFMGARQLDFGKPFIAAFEKETGKQKFLTLIEAKDDLILGYHLLNNEIYLVFKTRIAKYAKETGNLILERGFSAEEFGELRYFVGNQVYITNGNGFYYSLPQSDSTKVYVLNDKGKTLVIDNELNVTRTIDYEDLNILYEKTPDYAFLAKDKLTSVVNREGFKVAEIEASPNAFLIGNTLYDRQDVTFSEIDLTQIIGMK